MSSTRTLERLVTSTSSNKDSNSRNGGAFHCFCADTNAVLSDSSLHGAVNDQGLWDFTSFKITKVFFRRLSREL